MVDTGIVDNFIISRLNSDNAQEKKVIVHKNEWQVTGTENGKQYTRIVCIEGHVYARSTYPTIIGSVKIEPGQMTTVFDGEPLSAPIITPPHIKERLLTGTDVSQYEVPMPKPVALKKIKEGILHKPSLNRIVNDAPLQTQDPGVRGVTPVTIDIQFPD